MEASGQPGSTRVALLKSAMCHHQLGAPRAHAAPRRPHLRRDPVCQDGPVPADHGRRRVIAAALHAQHQPRGRRAQSAGQRLRGQRLQGRGAAAIVGLAVLLLLVPEGGRLRGRAGCAPVLQQRSGGAVRGRCTEPDVPACSSAAQGIVRVRACALVRPPSSMLRGWHEEGAAAAGQTTRPAPPLRSRCPLPPPQRPPPPSPPAPRAPAACAPTPLMVTSTVCLRGSAITARGMRSAHSMMHTSRWNAASKSTRPAILSALVPSLRGGGRGGVCATAVRAGQQRRGAAQPAQGRGGTHTHKHSRAPPLRAPVGRTCTDPCGGWRAAAPWTQLPHPAAAAAAAARTARPPPLACSAARSPCPADT